MDESPTVSIIIPVKPGGRVKALERLREADYPCDRFEVLVVEGRQPSRQRNRAAAASGGDILYFLDDDSLVSPGFLRRAVAHYRDPGVAAVGGPSLTPETDSVLQRSFALAFASIFGGGGMRNRYRQAGEARPTSDKELILCNLSFRRERFLALGGFDERLYPNEENELLERVGRDGGTLLHDPGLAVYRSQRADLGAFCRQLFGYGRGRAEQTILSGVIRPLTFIPSLFLCYLLLLPLSHNPVYYVPLLCYLIMALFASAFELSGRRRPGPALLLPAIFPVFHLCYGLGFIRGLAAFPCKMGPCGRAEVTVRRVKEFGGGWKEKEDE